MPKSGSPGRRWRPGADPYVLEKGLGMWLPAGGDLVLEVHYRLNGRATADRSEIGFVPDSPADRQRIVSASERSWCLPAHVSGAEIARLLARLPDLQ